jgi:hypothetical protein
MMETILKYLTHPIFFAILAIILSFLLPYFIDKIAPESPRNKKPIYRKWHFYLIIILIVILFFFLIQFLMKNKPPGQILIGGGNVSNIDNMSEIGQRAINNAVQNIRSTSREIFMDQWNQ